MKSGIIEQLVHCTVRLETTLQDGTPQYGTGFYMDFLYGNMRCPLIITNKHVVKGCKTLKFHVTMAKDDGSPDIGNHRCFEIPDFQDLCVEHPDQNVDLVAIAIARLLDRLEKSGNRVFYMTLPIEQIPKTIEWESLSFMEDIIMIGYPNGIWDETNNLPIIRRGITATHCNIDYNGKAEFLTDIASFPGSSGSPVFLVSIDKYTDNKGNDSVGTRAFLLGIHCAGGCTESINGIKIFNHLGVVINSKRILEIEKLIQERFVVNSPRRIAAKLPYII
jgi:hypothetical protein